MRSNGLSVELEVSDYACSCVLLRFGESWVSGFYVLVCSFAVSCVVTRSVIIRGKIRGNKKRPRLMAGYLFLVGGLAEGKREENGGAACAHGEDDACGAASRTHD